ncbi:MAG TPA: DUF2167 domain-containing protein [Candidatus Baltobacteraceae bacterium]
MRLARCVVIVGIAAGMVFSATATGWADPQTDQHWASVRHEIRAMHWSAGAHPLDASHGTFAPPGGAIMVEDSEARRFSELVNGESSPNTEAIVRLRNRDILYLDYIDSGFVTVDDWKDIKPADMIKSISDATENSNKARADNGVPAVHVVGWIEEPVLDPVTKTVRWIVRFRGDGQAQTFSNAIALHLGRRGYERFTLASDDQNPRTLTASLNGLSGDYQFTRGFRFQDYVAGDKLAGYGIAALVGTVAGAAIAKTIGWGVVLLMIKKFFVLIVAGGAAGFRWLRGFFKRRASIWQPTKPDDEAPRP